MTVADLDAAVDWYGEMLGLEPIGPPVAVRAGEEHAGVLAAEVFGAGFGELRQVHLASANGVALELFEFSGPASAPVHACFVTPDVERTAERIATAGGGRRMPRARRIFVDEPYLTCYCQDPSGNTIELYSHSHERTYSNRGKVR